MKPVKDKRALDTSLLDIVGQVIELTWGYSVWWVIADKSNRPKLQQVLESYPNYFQATFTLFQTAFFVSAHRLFDYEKSSISLRSLVQSLETSNPARAAALKKRLRDNDDVLRKVLRLRHNVYGHRSKSVSPATEFARLGIKPKDMKTALQLAQEITVELALELGVRNSTLLADKFRRCEQDVRHEAFVILAALAKGEVNE